MPKLLYLIEKVLKDGYLENQGLNRAIHIELPQFG